MKKDCWVWTGTVNTATDQGIEVQIDQKLVGNEGVIKAVPK